ncbi:MAG: LysE family translocator [Bacteroidales bacterium]
MPPFIEGIIFGLGLATVLGFGPALFAMVQTSINKGFPSAVLLAIGVFFSDLLLVLLSFVGIIQFINRPANKLAFGIISGLILIVFGIFTYRKEVSMEPADTSNIKIGKIHSLKCFFKGFFLNIANPFIWIFWMGTMVLISTKYIGSSSSVLVFFAGTLMTVLSADILKSLGASKIKKFFTIKKLQIFNHLTGIALAICGGYFIIRVIYELYFQK